MKQAALTVVGLVLVHELLAQLLVGQATMAQLLSPDDGAFAAVSLVAATIMLRLLVLLVLPAAVAGWIALRLAARLAGRGPPRQSVGAAPPPRT